MGLEDKFDAAKDQVSGQAKETAGKVTGDKETQGEGAAQNLQGKLKDGVEQVKDAASDAKDAAKGFTDKLKNN